MVISWGSSPTKGKGDPGLVNPHPPHKDYQQEFLSGRCHLCMKGLCPAIEFSKKREIAPEETMPRQRVHDHAWAYMR